jgi:glycosyltransferase involved in cell wall biosynthesis
VTTVIIPAHNEAQVIERLLKRITEDAQPGELEIIVVANGCTDKTADIAAACGPMVRAVSIATPSKHEAFLAGDRLATDFPRIYVDADVEIGTEDLRALAEALGKPGVLAVGPSRFLELTDSPLLVRWYYDVWQRLPAVRDGLFGRGVIGLDAAGHARVTALPRLMSDDLGWSLAFSDNERLVVGQARVVLRVPRTIADLLRRRTRAATGVAQLESTEGAPSSTARTRPADLLAMARQEPQMIPRILVFAAMALAAKRQGSKAARRGDYSTWLRDEGSRCS